MINKKLSLSNPPTPSQGFGGDMDKQTEKNAKTLFFEKSYDRVCTDCIWKGHLNLEGFMEEVASGLKPEASVTEIQMSRRWGRMAFKVKGINGLYKGPEMKMCVTVGGTQDIKCGWKANQTQDLTAPWTAGCGGVPEVFYFTGESHDQNLAGGRSRCEQWGKSTGAMQGTQPHLCSRFPPHSPSEPSHSSPGPLCCGQCTSPREALSSVVYGVPSSQAKLSPVPNQLLPVTSWSCPSSLFSGS